MAGVKGKSGRKKMSNHQHLAIMLLTETAPHAANYLKRAVTGQLPKGNHIDPLRLDACKYVLNQHLGMPRQRIDFDVSQEAERIAKSLGLAPELLPSVAKDLEAVLLKCQT